MMKHSIAIGLFVAASMASAFQVCAADTIALDSNNSQPLAVVGAYARHVGDKIVYHYRVTNYSQQNITAVTIGHDDQNDGNPNNDVNELASLPSGWTDTLDQLKRPDRMARQRHCTRRQCSPCDCMGTP